MATTTTPRKFEVSFSFLASDEPLARDLADRLAPLSTFVYSRQQEHLVATNALESFRTTFRNDTLVPVILFRRGWGSTPITRVESMAIQEYCAFEDGGWDRLVFVTLDDDRNFPGWLHKQHIRFDLRTFPLDQLVGAIKNTVLKAGGTVRAPTAAEVAAQLAAREQFDQETQRLLMMSGNTFLEAAGALFLELDAQIDQIGRSSGWTVVHGHEPGQYVVFLDRVSMQLLAKELHTNTSRNAHFVLRHFKGRLLTPIEINARMMLATQPSESMRDQVRLVREPGLGWAWLFRSQVHTHANLASLLLREFLERRTIAMHQPSDPWG